MSGSSAKKKKGIVECSERGHYVLIKDLDKHQVGCSILPEIATLFRESCFGNSTASVS